mgnify:CR=1 FL=1
MTRKLDKEHLDAIQELQQQFAQNANWLGTVSIEIKMLEQQQTAMQNRYDELFRQFETLRDKEQKLVNDLRERYGEGEIDIVNGTFTSDDSGLK